MHSFLAIGEYTFDTAALRDAIETVESSSNEEREISTERGLIALLEYFCDWAPTRQGNLNNHSAAGVSSLSESDQDELLTQLSERLSENLNDQYSVDSDGSDVQDLAWIFANKSLDYESGKDDFALNYLRRFAVQLRELDPDKNESIGNCQNLLNQIRNLPHSYLEAKRSQYSGSRKINEIRYRLLEEFRTDGRVDLAILEEIKTDVAEQYDGDILNSWRDYTILGQIYYDYFKPRIDRYLELLADRILVEFDEYELETHVVNFQGAQNFLGDFAWISAHIPPRGSVKDCYQLYMGIHGDRLRAGLHVGSNLREGDWEEDRDVESFSADQEIEFERILRKLRTVEDDFVRLSGLTTVRPDGIERPDRADEILRQLEAKKQVVFYGPPGTGKTYIAKQFADWWLSESSNGEISSNQSRLVTFHPSFTYEDFIEGLTVDTNDAGEINYRIKDGIFKRLCREARADYEDVDDAQEATPYVLIIDEINRGNLSQIFGETITLLEEDKRGTVTAQLAHSGADGPDFTVPPNLYVIGTMNTADRSIALVDAALRRRFRFIHFPPDYGVICDDYDWVDDLNDARRIAENSEDKYRALLSLSILGIEQLNQSILNSSDLGKGKQIGHSYLMDLENSQEVVDAWRFDILPLLEEYYFGQFDRIRQDIFDGGGDELVDWENERIKKFGGETLLSALGSIVGMESSPEVQEDELSESTEADQATED